MKNSFSVMLFLICGMLMHCECGAMGPVKSLNEITKDVRGLKKDVSTLSTKLTQQNDTFGTKVANLRDQLQQQGVTLGDDISELRVQLQQQNEKFEKRNCSYCYQPCCCFSTFCSKYGYITHNRKERCRCR